MVVSLPRLAFVFLGISLAASQAGPANADGRHERIVLVAGAAVKGEMPVAGPLRTPFGIDADAEGNLYIAELTGQRIWRLGSDQRLTPLAGTGEKGFAGDGGSAAAACFNGMHNLAFGPAGDLYVADTWNRRIRKIDARTGVVSTVCGTGEKGFAGDGGPAIKATCGDLYCVSYDRPRNRLLLADLDNRRIRAITLADGKISTIAGNGQRGVPADGSRAVESPLVDPRAVTCDAGGTIYILERSGHALRAVTPGGHIRTVAGTGKRGPAITDCTAREATFNGPKHLCTDRQGNVVIADAENHVIVKYLPAENRVVRIAGSGRKGSAGVGGSPLAVELNQPHGVFIDARDTLYIVDSSNDRVLKLVSRP